MLSPRIPSLVASEACPGRGMRWSTAAAYVGWRHASLGRTGCQHAGPRSPVPSHPGHPPLLCRLVRAPGREADATCIHGSVLQHLLPPVRGPLTLSTSQVHHNPKVNAVSVGQWPDWVSPDLWNRPTPRYPSHPEIHPAHPELSSHLSHSRLPDLPPTPIPWTLLSEISDGTFLLLFPNSL